jgi:hypothetical protein
LEGALAGCPGTGTAPERKSGENSFLRNAFPEFEQLMPSLMEKLPELLMKVYSDCQMFAEKEIRSLLERFEQASDFR